MRKLVTMSFVGLVGCGSVSAIQADAPLIIDRMCDPMGTFDAPLPLTGFNTAADEGAARLTPDELELYFRRRPDAGTTPDIYRALRNNPTQTFGTPLALTSI